MFAHSVRTSNYVIVLFQKMAERISAAIRNRRKVEQATRDGILLDARELVYLVAVAAHRVDENGRADEGPVPPGVGARLLHLGEGVSGPPRPHHGQT